MENHVKKKRPRGRPKGWTAINPKAKRLPAVNVTDDQLATYKAAAKQSDKTFSAWVRGALDKEAINVTKEKPK